jgi:hypothetical protein
MKLKLVLLFSSPMPYRCMVGSNISQLDVAEWQSFKFRTLHLGKIPRNSISRKLVEEGNSAERK